MPRGAAVPQSGRRSRVLFDCEARPQTWGAVGILLAPGTCMVGDGSLSVVSTAGFVMAGDWIKMRSDLAEDPSVIGIAAKVGIDEFAVVGRLHHLWAWVDCQSRDGHADGVTHSWIDRKVQCPGFALAMQAVGWLIVDETGMQIPNFERHNGKTAKTRALSANRQQNRRASVTHPVAESVTQLNTNESRSPRDICVTREEKRREEKKEQKQKLTPSASPTADAKMPDLPEWVNGEAWEGFAAMRRRERHPLTPRAAKLVLNELTRLRDTGQDANAVLDQSTRQGWRDVYPLKPSQQSGRPQNRPEPPDYLAGAV